MSGTGTRRSRGASRGPLPGFGGLLLTILALLPLPAPAAQEVDANQPIALPPYIVEEAAKGPPWRYAEANGQEVLSRCSDGVTRRVVEAYRRLHQLLGEILPRTLQLTVTVPKALILYDEDLLPAASQEVVARLLRAKPEAPPLDLPSPFGGGRGMRPSPGPPRYSFLPNLRLWDRDAMALFMIVPRAGYDSETLSLTPNYIAYLLQNRVPTLPLWFVQGFAALHAQARYEGRELSFGPFEWVSPAATDELKRDPPRAPPLLPLVDFFTGQLPRPDGELAPGAVVRWQSQAALFIRWGFDGAGAPRRAALWTFVERSALRGESEPLFRECFGLDYATALAQLTAYRPVALRNTVRLRLPREAQPPPLPLRDASPAQIARIKGDWERMEVPYVKAISPELTGKYLEQARRTLARAYDREERDPRLLAVFGLLECDAGDDRRAQELLEAAVRIGPLRPRAAYELARLRLAGRRGASPDGRLTAAQAAEVLTLLFAARELEPPLPEVYELIGETWAHCEAAPTRGHLRVLDEGVRLFPRRSALIHRAASLNARYGFREEAAALIELGLHTAADDAARESFGQLQQQLGRDR